MDVIASSGRASIPGRCNALTFLDPRSHADARAGQMTLVRLDIVRVLYEHVIAAGVGETNACHLAVSDRIDFFEYEAEIDRVFFEACMVVWNVITHLVRVLVMKPANIPGQTIWPGQLKRGCRSVIGLRGALVK